MGVAVPAENRCVVCLEYTDVCAPDSTMKHIEWKVPAEKRCVVCGEYTDVCAPDGTMKHIEYKVV